MLRQNSYEGTYRVASSQTSVRVRNESRSMASPSARTSRTIEQPLPNILGSENIGSSRSSMNPDILRPRREDLEKWFMEVLDEGDRLIDSRSDESSEQRSNHTIPEYADDLPHSIEEEIKERNRAFKMLKTNSLNHAPRTNPPDPTKKATLYAVPVE
ncbi:hypothetical protein BDU57DRAFT_41818 [Ampelomyces quisqualis]|uniref:Uncharacterized protein n=1 Tax=Ampelomyces quisqualis TaxID=50730 RepID=A0A6A5R349_AMPQU|nr:hypothetical protein BDU57DRAFT_41818 [Ampelomyces quisqualis]